MNHLPSPWAFYFDNSPCETQMETVSELVLSHCNKSKHVFFSSHVQAQASAFPSYKESPHCKRTMITLQWVTLESSSMQSRDNRTASIPAPGAGCLQTRLKTSVCARTLPAGGGWFRRSSGHGPTAPQPRASACQEVLPAPPAGSGTAWVWLLHLVLLLLKK